MGHHPQKGPEREAALWWWETQRPKSWTKALTMGTWNTAPHRWRVTHGSEPGLLRGLGGWVRRSWEPMGELYLSLCTYTRVCT